MICCVIIMTSVTVAELENLLDTTASPNTLLRPRFWRMGLRRFTEGFSNQFIGRGTANEVYFMQILLCLIVLFPFVSDNESTYFQCCYFRCTRASGLGTRGWPRMSQGCQRWALPTSSTVPGACQVSKPINSLNYY